ncbi:MAG: hypothetical protein KF912_12930 [Phycisphaeraceae bacterium]|nr:hypothetical protein [Phycisphaeraceae bacterium]
MAKMFYTLEEAAAKLGKSPEDVKAMAESGQLQEFRDRDRMMFKVDQVDLLAGHHDDEMIPLADDDLEPMSLASSGSAPSLSLDNPKEQTGISIFETEDTDSADPMAATQITTSPAAGFTPGDAGGSGSGLLDMTREADDTSLGADLLEDVYGGETQAETALGSTSPGGTGEAAALFESTSAASDITAAAAAAAPVMVLAEVIDGPGSGLAAGLAIGMVLALAFTAVVVLMAMTGGGAAILGLVAGNFMAIVGGLAGVCVIAAVVGFLMLKNAR